MKEFKDKLKEYQKALEQVKAKQNYHKVQVHDITSISVNITDLWWMCMFVWEGSGLRNYSCITSKCKKCRLLYIGLKLCTSKRERGRSRQAQWWSSKIPAWWYVNNFHGNCRSPCPAFFCHMEQKFHKVMGLLTDISVIQWKLIFLPSRQNSGCQIRRKGNCIWDRTIWRPSESVWLRCKYYMPYLPKFKTRI